MSTALSNALSTFRALLRRPSSRQWSRLERTLGESALPTVPLADDRSAVTDTAELRNFLAAQTSQVV